MECRYIVVDLKTGKEETLIEKGSYSTAGHLFSFAGTYYNSKSGVHCYNYVTKSRYLIHDVLCKSFTMIITWVCCFKKNCISIITGEEENNVCLFNLDRQQMEDRSTLCLRKADSVYVSIRSAMKPSNSPISVTYSCRRTNGILKHLGIENFILELEQI